MNPTKLSVTVNAGQIYLHREIAGAQGPMPFAVAPLNEDTAVIFSEICYRYNNFHPESELRTLAEKLRVAATDLRQYCGPGMTRTTRASLDDLLIDAGLILFGGKSNPPLQKDA